MLASVNAHSMSPIWSPISYAFFSDGSRDCNGSLKMRKSLRTQVTLARTLLALNRSTMLRAIFPYAHAASIPTYLLHRVPYAANANADSLETP